MTRIFVSDCEGPISKNDNAFETTSHFVPSGDKLFMVISRYDDALADILKRPGYKAGDTLKLVLPFLKAYSATDQKMREFSTKNLVLVSNVKHTLQYVMSITRAFIVSTSYEHYMKALCEAVRFPFENTYCTRFSIDKYKLSTGEETELKKTAQEIAQIPVIEIPPNAQSLNDLSKETHMIIRRLDEIFWQKIARMKIGKIYSEVSPVGGSEKAQAIEDIVQKQGTTLAEVMYVGDSITDQDAFKLVRKNGGLAVSFNGNQYAIKGAEIAILSETSIVTAIIADVFAKSGKQKTLDLVENWNLEALGKSKINQSLIHHLLKLHPGRLPKVKIITNKNMETLAKESSAYRAKVRGKIVGRLG